MTSAARYLIAILLFGIVGLTIMGCAGCGKRPDEGKQQPVETKQEELPPEMPKEFTGKFTGATKFTIGLDGQRAWSAEVQSGEIRSKDGRQTFTLTGLTCHLYQNGREILQVSADKGTAVRTGKILHTDLTGHIQAIEKKKNQRLQADSFRWISTEKVVHAQHFIWAGDGAILHADQGTFSIDLTDAKFTGHVRLESTDPAAR